MLVSEVPVSGKPPAPATKAYARSLRPLACLLSIFEQPRQGARAVAPVQCIVCHRRHVPLAPCPPAALQKYEKNVRKGLLTDSTIGLWDASALRVGLGRKQGVAAWLVLGRQQQPCGAAAPHVVAPGCAAQLQVGGKPGG